MYIVETITNATEKEILFYENYDMESLVSPINAAVFQNLLEQTAYDPEELKFVIDGFRNGFPIGYDGDMNAKLTSNNLKFHGVGSELELWNKVMKEVKNKRFAGPFEEIPFKEHYIQSPIGLVEKDNGKDTRLIFHLSYPRGKGLSVNENTPRHLCQVKYPDFDKAIQMCMQEGKSCKISRTDVKSAFRNLCIRKQDFWLMVMKAKSPKDGKYYYFFDKALAFGASISCSHFQ